MPNSLHPYPADQGEALIEPLTTDHRGRLYCTLGYFETNFGRSHWTVRAWVTTGKARHLTVGSTVYVHLGDARKLDRHTPRQQRGNLRNVAS